MTVGAAPVAEDHKTAFTELLVIDAAPLLSADTSEAAQTARLATARQLHKACLECGFFYLSGHGVPQDVLKAARTWFARPVADKKQLALSPSSHYRGYAALGANINNYGDKGEFTRDWHEGIDLYREVQDGQQVSASAIHGLNPSVRDASFQQALNHYVERCLVLGQAIMRGIALGLGLAADAFEEQGVTAETSYWVLRAIFYPPLPGTSPLQAQAGQAALQDTDEGTQLSCAAHSDYGLLTFVSQEDEVTALQVRNAAGSWVSATPVPGTLVCNIGDMLRVWTNGQYTPTLHRVINAHPEKSRVSVPFFYEPAFETVVSPLEQLCAEGAPRVPAVRYGSHLESRVFSNFALD